MSLRELIDTAQAVALANKLAPSEEAVYDKYCREFSKRFFTKLSEVKTYNPEYVLTQLFSDYIGEWSEEERLDDILDLLGTLKDPDYDAKRERALRQEYLKMEEEEKLRLQEKRAIHPSLEKKTFREKPKEEKSETKQLPKQGGINMDLVRKLNQSDNEG